MNILSIAKLLGLCLLGLAGAFSVNLYSPVEAWGAYGPGFLWPVEGPITSPYGWRAGWFGTKRHDGVDIGAPKGTEVNCSYSGEVIFSGQKSGYGNIVILDHGNGYKTYYAHLNSRRVELGQRVEQGESLGTVGETGNATRPNLHFEIRYNGEPRNPTLWMIRH